MTSSGFLIRRSTQIPQAARRLFSTQSVTAPSPAQHRQPPQNHSFLEPNSFIGSWSSPKDPKEAEARLAQLRRDYAKQVKEVRKLYIHEVEMMRLEKQRKDEARKEALRQANEEKKRLKAEAAKARAEERKLAQQEFRETLMKERAQKLEFWRMKVKQVEEKKKEKKELTRLQSSLWVDETELENKMFVSIADYSTL